MPQLTTRATGRDLLRCRRCGTEFPEGRATEDGWHYACPEESCDAKGLGDGLKRVE
ncbi:HVO_2901 family zinc finger protein [Halobaculum halobium]|uniref:HVO_2901 family zinc finger protein n=1 Tax=Halobaculum halobium TaxID=3032281 RepID=A0ABD5TDY4_9EURY|nr:HVO_2901 family zinc finger protein [Halobaculum sp. SYNS20]